MPQFYIVNFNLRYIRFFIPIRIKSNQFFIERISPICECEKEPAKAINNKQDIESKNTTKYIYDR